MRRALVTFSLGIAILGLGCAREPQTPALPIVGHVEVGEPTVVAVAPAPPVTVPVRFVDEQALAPEDSDPADLLAEATRLAETEDADTAMRMARKTLYDGGSSDEWLLVGTLYGKAGKSELALRALQEAVSADPSSPTARTALVQLALKTKDATLARDNALELIAARPADASALQLLGRSYLQLGMWKEAVSRFEQVLALEPDSAYAHNNLGFAALQLGDNETARVHLEACLSLRPLEGYMLNNLGVAYERLGRSAEAHAAFSRAAELSPKYLQAQLNRDRVVSALTQDQRIASAEALMQLRAPIVGDDDEELLGPAVPSGIDLVGGAALNAGAGAGAASVRLAPVDTQP